MGHVAPPRWLLAGAVAASIGLALWCPTRPWWALPALLASFGLGLVWSKRRQRQQQQLVVHALTTRVARAEEQHELSRQRFGWIMQSVSEVVALLDTKGVVQEANSALERALGVQPSELVGKSLLTLLAEPDHFAAEAARQESTRTGRAQLLCTLLHADGQSRRRMSVVFQRLDPGLRDEPGTVVSCRDVTEEQRLMDELLRTQKVELLGRLASGLAHDFNNLLAIIRSGTELVALSVPRDHACREDLLAVQEAADHAASLTGQLLAFTRHQVVGPRRADIGPVLTSLGTVLARLVGKQVTIDVAVEPELPALGLSSTEFQQIVMNLAINARDAMPHGGKLTIRANHLKATGRVELIVSDSGVGMNAETQAHLFEPFYSTKDPGKGSGLGLATVQALVERVGGKITVVSGPNQGARFELNLPISVEATPRPPAVATGGPQRILVVDDEGTVRNLVVRVLKNAGFEVLSASDLEEAVSIAAEVASLDGLISDVMLGAVDASGSLGRFREHHPNLAIVMISGYAPNPERLMQLAREGVGFVPKPFTPRVLTEAVRAALGRRGQ